MILEPLADSRWDERLLAHEDATIFHTAAWARVLVDAYGFRPCYLGEVEGDRFGVLLPLMDVRSLFTGRRGVSLPFSDFCHPLVPDGSRVADLLDTLGRLGRQRRWGYVDFHGAERVFPHASPAVSFCQHTISLAPHASLSKLKPNARRNVRKAARAGVTVSVETSCDAVERYYALHTMVRKDKGLPPQPLAFFRRIHENIISQGRGCIILAAVGGRLAAGAVFFHFGRRAIFKYGASDRRLLACRPNDMVLWEAIRMFSEGNMQQLCLGRTDLTDDGLRRFKSGFGGTEQIRHYHRYDPVHATFGSARSLPGAFPRNVMRRMPACLSRLIGRIAYRHAA